MAQAFLTNAVYAGHVTYAGSDEHGNPRRGRRKPVEWFGGKHEALVSPADFARAQELRAMFAHRVRLGRKQPCLYPLSGLLLCDGCGKPLRGMTSYGKAYYRDATHLNHAGSCTQRTVREPAWLRWRNSRSWICFVA